MELIKKLRTFDVFSIGAGAMISSGLFVLPAIAFKETGVGILLAYFIAGILMIPSLFTKLELSTAIPKAGGTYFYVERILGTSSGTLAGFLNWFSVSLKSAFALVGIGAFFSILFPAIGDWQIKLIALGACVFFTVLNLLSVEASGRVQSILVAALLLILVAYIVTGYRSIEPARYDNLFPVRWDKIIATTGMVFISYGGITKIASIAEEVKNPKRTLLVGMLGAFIVVQALYLLVIFVLIGICPPAELESTLTPVSYSASLIAGGVGMGITACGAILAFITTANAGIMTASRVPLAMSRDGLLPEFFARVSRKHRVPFIPVIMTGLFMSLIITFLDIANLAKVASLFMLLLFILANVSVIVIRYSKIANYRPTFRSPLFPFLQIGAVVAYIVLIIQMGLFIILFSLAFIAMSVAWFFLYVRRKTKRQSALIHMIRNVTAKEIASEPTALEEELLAILQKRDDIIEDRFDKIIRQARIIDLKEQCGREEVFRLLSEEIEKKLGLPAALVLGKLNEREEQTSTLLYPGIAIPHAVPHIIVSGERIFDVFVVRNNAGIVWNEGNEIVYTVFCLIGTKDERNFHLKALAAIAQIIQDLNYAFEWHRAQSEKELRSILLLARRKRHED